MKQGMLCALLVAAAVPLFGGQNDMPLDPSASAARTAAYDPATSTGFVGNGEVQAALGLNTATLRSLAGTDDGILFTYVKTDTYMVINAWASGNPEDPVSNSSYTTTVTSLVNINAAALHALRNNLKSDVTGFNLTGLGSEIVVGEIPAVNSTVTTSQGIETTVLSVTPLGSQASLYVNGVRLPLSPAM